MKALTKITRSIKPAEVEKKWHLIDADGLVDLAASRSYVITETPERRAEILAAVRALAVRIADEHGEVTMPYRTLVYRYRVAR